MRFGNHRHGRSVASGVSVVISVGRHGDVFWPRLRGVRLTVQKSVAENAAEPQHMHLDDPFASSLPSAPEFALRTTAADFVVRPGGWLVGGKGLDHEATTARTLELNVSYHSTDTDQGDLECARLDEVFALGFVQAAHAELSAHADYDCKRLVAPLHNATTPPMSPLYRFWLYDACTRRCQARGFSCGTPRVFPSSVFLGDVVRRIKNHTNTSLDATPATCDDDDLQSLANANACLRADSRECHVFELRTVQKALEDGSFSRSYENLHAYSRLESACRDHTRINLTFNNSVREDCASKNWACHNCSSSEELLREELVRLGQPQLLHTVTTPAHVNRSRGTSDACSYAAKLQRCNRNFRERNETSTMKSFQRFCNNITKTAIESVAPSMQELAFTAQKLVDGDDCAVAVAFASALNKFLPPDRWPQQFGWFRRLVNYTSAHCTGDSTLLSYVIDVNVSVTNENDHAPVIAVDSIYASVSESTATNLLTGKTIVEVEASDLDGDHLTYTVASCESHSKRVSGEACPFRMLSSSVVVQAEVDFEVASAYNLTVMVSDGLHDVSCVVHISVLDQNDCAPTFARHRHAANVSEALEPGGTIINSLVVSDLDSNSVLEFSLPIKQLEAKSAFELNPLPFDVDGATGRIFTTDYLDFTAEDAYNFTVEVTDAAGHKDRAVVIVDVGDVVEFGFLAPGFWAPEVTGVEVNPPVGGRPRASVSFLINITDAVHPGSSIVQFDAGYDEPSPARVAYRLLDEANPAFFMEDGWLVLRDDSRLDHTSTPRHVLKVHAHPVGFPRQVALATIIINVAKPSPTDFIGELAVESDGDDDNSAAIAAVATVLVVLGAVISAAILIYWQRQNSEVHQFKDPVTMNPAYQPTASETNHDEIVLDGTGVGENDETQVELYGDEATGSSGDLYAAVDGSSGGGGSGATAGTDVYLDDTAPADADSSSDLYLDMSGGAGDSNETQVELHGDLDVYADISVDDSNQPADGWTGEQEHRNNDDLYGAAVVETDSEDGEIDL